MDALISTAQHALGILMQVAQAAQPLTLATCLLVVFLLVVALVQLRG